MDRIVFFNRVPFARHHGFTPEHSELGEATLLTNGIVPLPDQGVPPHRVRFNLFGASCVVPFGAGLLCARPLAEELSRRALIRWRPVEVASAYYFPFCPGNTSYEADPHYVPDTDYAEEAIAGIVEAYKCEVPANLSDLEIWPARSPDGRGGRPAEQGREIIIDDPDRAMRQERFVINEKHIRGVGIVWQRGFLCRPDVFECLAPSVREPAFLIHTIEC